MKYQLKPLCLALGMAGVLAGVSGGAAASGFQLLEQNSSGLGNAYAGTAASAEDASTIYFNPAGMSFLNGRDFAVSLSAIKPSSKFSNNGSQTTPVAGLFPLGTGTGGDAGDWALLPALYYAHAINSNLSLGLSVNAPFGLKTEYDADWIGRFQAIKSELKTIAITPTVAYRFTPTTSVGLGIRAQKADAELTSATSPLAPGAQNKLEGDDWGWGFSLGILSQVTPGTRIGAAYQSQVKHEVKGTLTSVGLPGGSAPAKADVTLPDILTVSLAHQLNRKWELLADVAWTNWSKFQELRVVNASTGALLSLTPENWDDTWRVALGANYQYSGQWKLRFGVAYDETPVSDQFRTARIPDESRVWLAVGAQYKLTPKSAIDFGYAHLFVKDGSIDKTETLGAGPSGTRLRGDYDNRVDIIGVQYSHSF